MASQTPTIYDVATLANVSVATVSRCINGSANVEPATRARVAAAISELGFVRNATAQRLSSGKNKIIGLVFPKDFIPGDGPDVERESMLFIDTVMRGIEFEASRNDYSVLISFVDLDLEQRLEALERMLGAVDGIIALERVFTADFVSEIEYRLPVVVLAGGDTPANVDVVRSDNEGAMVAIAEHLVTQHGIQHAGFIQGRLNSPDADQRLDSFAAAFRERGGTVDDVDILRGDFTVVGGIAAMQDRMTSDVPLPEVFVSANDQMAYGAISVLQDHGREVPSDIFFTGFDDTPMSQLMTPPLTTVRQDTIGMGTAAVQLLIDAMANPKREKKLVSLPTQLVVRYSCGCSNTKGMDLVREMAS